VKYVGFTVISNKALRCGTGWIPERFRRVWGYLYLSGTTERVLTVLLAWGRGPILAPKGGTADTVHQQRDTKM
jgi:hypothetical protein